MIEGSALQRVERDPTHTAVTALASLDRYDFSLDISGKALKRLEANKSKLTVALSPSIADYEINAASFVWFQRGRFSRSLTRGSRGTTESYLIFPSRNSEPRFQSG